MALALEREATTCRSLLMVAGAIRAGLEPMLARLVRGFIALAFTACVLAVACSHRLADTINGGKLSYMALAMQREPTAYRSLLMVAEAVLAGPEPMLARLVRGCIALASTACVFTRPLSRGARTNLSVRLELQELLAKSYPPPLLPTVCNTYLIWPQEAAL